VDVVDCVAVGVVDWVVVGVVAGVVAGVVCCAGVEDCRWLGVVGADWAGVVCVTVPRLVPVLGAVAVDGRTEAVAGDTTWATPCDGGLDDPVDVPPWPFELVSSTATIAATPHSATPTPAAARRRLPKGKPRVRSG
jgi:hypothetical protein